MTNKLFSVRSLFVLFSVLVLANPAVGGEFQWGGANVSFNSQLSIGTSRRVEDIDLRLVTAGNTMGMGTASSSTTDDGNLNFEKGDTYSLIFKGVHDLEISKGDFGVFLRAKYWYDEELDNGIRPHGNLLNGYARNEKLDDSDFDDFAKSSGFELLDAYLYGSFTVGENIPLDLRIGRQVLSWGESTFIQNGLNVINPVDVSAFRRPGAEIKEGLLPVNLFSLSAGLTDNLSVDLFYQLEWEKTVIDGCGTYFSDNDVAATGCDGVTLSNVFSDQASFAAGLAVRRIDDLEPDDSGQWGISLRYFAEKLNGSEFGLYYINHHSRIPLLGGITSNNIPLGLPALFVPGDPLGGNPKYTAEFPEDIEIFGVTFATNFSGVAVSGEISYRPEQPVQINPNDILVTAVANAPYSPVTPRAVAAGPGALLGGYDRLPVTQAQVTVIKFFEQIMGADRLSVGAEFGANFVGSLAPVEELRYGRSTTFGNAFAPIPVTELGIPIPGDFLTCEAGYSTPAGSPVSVFISPGNPTPENCALDGFITDTSYGYRIRGALTYTNAFAGITLTPSLAWAHDIEGYSPNTNFLEDRKALSVALGAEYNYKYSAKLSYTTFFDGDWNTQIDRDFVSLSFDMTF